MTSGKRWTVHDRYGNNVYLTEERWEHITEAINHPEMGDYEEELQYTIARGQRKQDMLNLQKHRYSHAFDVLPMYNTHVVAIVLFRFIEHNGMIVPNNYIVTAYMKEIGNNMTPSVLNYDEESDTLYVSFAPGEAATGIELNEQILLRINQHERRVIGITLFDYSVLAQQTELGPRSFPLTGLANLSAELRELVVNMLQAEPVRSVLAVSAYSPSPIEIVPITSVQRVSLMQSAA